MERKTSRTVADFGWPPILLTATAERYVQRSRHTLLRAVRNGELPIVGKRGKSFVFKREDLDRWMMGSGGTIVPINGARRGSR